MSTLQVLQFFENLSRYNGSIIALQLDRKEVNLFRNKFSSVEGFNIIDLAFEADFEDVDEMSLQLEIGFRINSLKLGPRTIFNIPKKISSGLRILLYRQGISVINVSLDDMDLFAKVICSYIHKPLEFEIKRDIIYCSTPRLKYIRDNELSCMGHMIRRSLMYKCKSLCLTYLSLGAEAESGDDAGRVGLRARHFNNSLKIKKVDVGSFGTKDYVLNLLINIRDKLLCGKEQTLITHVGDGYMNNVGMAFENIRYSFDSPEFKNYDLVIFDPPWGGENYFQNPSLNLTMSGPFEFTCPNQELVNDFIDDDNLKDEVIAWDLDYTIKKFKFNTVIVIGDKISQKDKEYAVKVNAVNVYFLYINPIDDKVKTNLVDVNLDSAVVLFRHVIHHFSRPKFILFRYLDYLCSLGLFKFIIREHDVTNSLEARSVFWKHKEFKDHNYIGGYHENFFSKDELINYLKDLSFKIDYVGGNVGQYRSYWMFFSYLDYKTWNFKFDSSNVLESSRFCKRAIYKLPFNFDFSPIKNRTDMFITSTNEYYLLFYNVPIDVVWEFAFHDILYPSFKLLKERKMLLPKEIMYQDYINKDALKVIGTAGEAAVALWSLSNIRNPKPRAVVKMLLNNCKLFYVSFPMRSIAKSIGFKILKKDDHDYMEQGTFSDWLADASDFLGLNVSILSMQTFHVKNELYAKKYENNDYMLNSIDPNFNLMNLWFIVTNEYIPPVQDVINTQAMGVKRSAQIMREVCGGSKDDFYTLRKVALKWLFPDAQIIKGGFFDGLIPWNHNGKKKLVKVAASGHLINLLCIANHQPICWRTYVRSIEMNVSDMNSIKDRDYIYYKQSLRKKEIVEIDFKRPDQPWHSYTDYYLGIATYYIYTKFTNMKFNFRSAFYLMRELKIILRKEPKFGIVFPGFIKDKMRGHVIRVDANWK